MKKRFHFLLFCIVITLYGCKHNKLADGEIFINEYNWTIKIPESFTPYEKVKWNYVRNAGKRVVEDANNIETHNKVHTVFIYNSGEDNFFEAASEPFDEKLKGRFVESCEATFNALYKAGSQFPGVKIDTTKTVNVIDDVEFRTFKARIVLPDGQVKNTISYCALFDKKFLTVSMMYTDENKALLMKKALEESHFE